MENLIDNITDVLKEIKYPGFSRDIVSFGIVKKINLDPNKNLIIQISLTTDNQENKDIISDSIKSKISEKFNFNAIQVIFENSSDSLIQDESESKNSIKKIVAISSCKGGVGKSTAALNIACELSNKYKVGLLDLDIYGPSLPTLINYYEQPEISNDIMSPIEKFGVKFMSFGFINNENSPTIWRGPMVSRMTQQFFDNVAWGELDYLILDLPPGTGDIQLTLVQKIKLFGAVIITTPQDLSNVDVRKGSDMFKKVNTPIIGVIENMSGLSFSGKIESDLDVKHIIINDKIVEMQNNKFEFIYDVFKGKSGEKESSRLNLPLLGKINIDSRLSESCDKGIPFVKEHKGSLIHKEFQKISNKIEAV
ncbi:MAG: chromosome partitioning protein [Candidatus Marinimicrobia bacterium]|nr:chromosome partitioning protein [Candidatus Neomarinimicrobiota bacterium]|tara:strand:- start:13634 stop:14728 length:1095 start_codon:yes stop_codon:yes gene_type:complete